MLINDAIRNLMKDNGVTQMIMAINLGRKRATDVGSMLDSKNMTCNQAIKMLSTMGYELVIQKRTSGKRSEGQIVLERSDLDKETK